MLILKPLECLKWDIRCNKYTILRMYLKCRVSWVSKFIRKNEKLPKELGRQVDIKKLSAQGIEFVIDCFEKTVFQCTITSVCNKMCGNVSHDVESI